MKNLIDTLLVRKTLPEIDAENFIQKVEGGYRPPNENPYKKKKSFSPSTLVWGNGHCARYWYLAFEGGNFIDDRSGREYANMKNGTASHERIQSAMEVAKVLLDKEIKVVNDDPPFFGFADVKVLFGNEIAVGEIKTMRQEAFEYRKTTGIGANYHIEQLLMYMYFLGIPLGLLIYESKNDHELFIITVRWTEEYEKWIVYLLDWLRTTHKAWQRKDIPKKTYRSNSKVCKGCPLQKECKEAPKGELTIQPLVGLER